MNVLFISSWYPTYLKPTNGNFIYKHAECAALYNNVHFYHVCIDPDLKVKSKTETANTPFYSEVVYLRSSKIPLLKKSINHINIIRTYFKILSKNKTKGFNPDFVHANIVVPVGIIALLFKWKFKIPYVISENWTGYHDYAAIRITKTQRLLARIIAKNAACLLPVSDDLKRAMQRNGLECDYKIVPNVADTELFKISDLNLHNPVKNIVHVSNLKESHKNFYLLLNALVNIKKHRSDFMLHIVSDGEIEPYAEFINANNLKEHIEFYGTLTTVGIADVLKKSDFFVLSSNYENLPCVLIESLAAGVPVVATNVGGVAEIIDNTNGIVVDSGNLTQITDAIAFMMDNARKYDKKQMHINAISKFSYQSIGQQFTDTYFEYIKK